MARRLRNNYNIDTLKLCFRQPKGLFDWIADTKADTIIPRDGYYLYIICAEDEEKPNSITCNVVTDDGTLIGSITFNSQSSRYSGLCFFRFDNKALYANYFCYKGNFVHCIDYIADDLDLEFNSITELHIANDSNVNKIAKLMRMRRDIEGYDLFINRKRVNRGSKLPDALKCCQMTRERDVNPSIRIEQKKKDAPKVVMYNKTVEIDEQSGKDYINEWNDFGKQTTYRSELRLKWEYIKEYFENKGISGYDVFIAILQPNTLEEMFEHFTTRLIYFRDRRTNEIISVHNIA